MSVKSEDWLKEFQQLPQRGQKAFERHPQVFYLSMKNNTCTAILIEPYRDKASVETHLLLAVRKKYIQLVKNLELILNVVVVVSGFQMKRVQRKIWILISKEKSLLIKYIINVFVSNQFKDADHHNHSEKNTKAAYARMSLLYENK